MLGDIPILIPQVKAFNKNWKIQIFDRATYACRSFMPANRRDFYKILFINQGQVIFTLGANVYYINRPAILFLHPNEICSWKNLSVMAGEPSNGHYCLFRKQYSDEHATVRMTADKYGFFMAAEKNVLYLPDKTIPIIDEIFSQMHREAGKNTPTSEDALRIYLELLMVESAKIAEEVKPHLVNEEFRHIHYFFQLLEKEFSCIDIDHPIRIRRVTEFADCLAIHPIYLNALLKKHTARTLKNHISDRMIDESKTFLLQTDWSLQHIGYLLGFDDQANFCRFFKNHTGLSPNRYKAHHKNHPELPR